MKQYESVMQVVESMKVNYKASWLKLLNGVVTNDKQTVGAVMYQHLKMLVKNEDVKINLTSNNQVLLMYSYPNRIVQNGRLLNRGAAVEIGISLPLYRGSLITAKSLQIKDRDDMDIVLNALSSKNIFSMVKEIDAAGKEQKIDDKKPNEDLCTYIKDTYGDKLNIPKKYRQPLDDYLHFLCKSRNGAAPTLDSAVLIEPIIVELLNPCIKEYINMHGKNDREKCCEETLDSLPVYKAALLARLNEIFL